MNSVRNRGLLDDLLCQIGLEKNILEDEVVSTLFRINGDLIEYNSETTLFHDVPEWKFMLKTFAGLYEIANQTSQEEKYDIGYREQWIRNYVTAGMEQWIIDVFSSFTGISHIALISAIAGEAYEGQEAKDFSMVVIPNDYDCSSDDARLFGANEQMVLSFQSVHGVRKLLEMAKYSQCLIVQNQCKGKHTTVGIGTRDKFEAKFPTIRFSGKTQWSFWLPTEKNEMLPCRCLFRCSHGMFLLPKVQRLSFLKKPLYESLERQSVTVADSKVSTIIAFIDCARKQSHGTTLIWLQTDNLSKEKERLCATGCRGFSVKRYISANEEELIQNITSIDGALLCNIDTGLCEGYGVILDGVANTSGKRERGARYNSVLSYIRGKGWQQSDNNENAAIAVICSEDGMLDLIEPEPP